MVRQWEMCVYNGSYNPNSSAIKMLKTLLVETLLIFVVARKVTQCKLNSKII